MDAQPEAYVPLMRDIHRPIEGIIIHIAPLAQFQPVGGIHALRAKRNTEVHAGGGKEFAERRNSLEALDIIEAIIRLHTMVREEKVMRLHTYPVHCAGRYMNDDRGLRRHEEVRSASEVRAALVDIVDGIIEREHHFVMAIQAQSGRVVERRRRITADSRHRTAHAHITRRTHARRDAERLGQRKVKGKR